MEPFSTALMFGAGLGFKAYGMMAGSDAADKYNQAQIQKINLEKQVEEQRRKAMELDARRKQLENFRQVQRARSAALTNATSQGAAQGSGLQGGYGQITAQGAWNSAGISQNLEIGRNIFGINSQITDTNITLANSQRDLQRAQGYTSFGGDLMNSAPGFGRLATGISGNYGSSSYSNNYNSNRGMGLTNNYSTGSYY